MIRPLFLLLTCAAFLTGCAQNTNDIGDSASAMISTFADLVPNELSTPASADATLHEFPEDGFAISLPPDWESVDLETFDVADLASEVVEQNELLAGQISSQAMRQLVAAGIRFYALNTSMDSLLADSPATINIIIEDLPVDLTLDEYATLSATQIERAFDLESEALEQGAVTLGDVDAQTLRYTATILNQFGDPLTVLNKQYFLLDGRRAFVITLSMSEELAASNLEPFSAVAQSFRLLPPEGDE